MRQLYELDDADIPDIKEIKPVACPQFWSYRQPITVQHLKLAVQDIVVTSQGESLKLLSKFLQQVQVFEQYSFVVQMIKASD